MTITNRIEVIDKEIGEEARFSYLTMPNKKDGCGVLFMIDNGSGIIICGQKRADGNKFLCKRCLREQDENNRTKRR